MKPCCAAEYYTDNKKIKNPFCPMCGNPIFIQKAIADGTPVNFKYLATDVRTGEHLPNCIVLHPELDAGAIQALNAYADGLKLKTQQGENLGPLTLDKLRRMDGKMIWVECIGVNPKDNWSGWGRLQFALRRIIAPQGESKCCHTDLMDWMDKGMYKEIRAYKNEVR